MQQAEACAICYVVKPLLWPFIGGMSFGQASVLDTVVSDIPPKIKKNLQNKITIT